MRRFIKFPVKISPEDLPEVVIINVDNVISIEQYDERYSVIRFSGFSYFVDMPMEETVKYLLNDFD